MVNKEKDAALEPALRDVDSIQNLDTARMALRWALERMRALEKRVQDVEASAKGAEEGRDRALAELDGSRDLLSRRAHEAAERERYYAKVEEYLNLKLEGGINPATMAQREARIDAREAELQRREAETETRVRTAKSRFEEETRRATAEAAASAELRIAEARAHSDKRAAALERELSERLLALHEKEGQLTSLEKSLEERRRRFEEFYRVRGAALRTEAAAVDQAAADQAAFVESRVEAAMAAKTAALDRAAAADKQILMDELATWRAKAREHLPELLESQRKADSLEAENARVAEENRLLQQAKTTLTEELLRWRQEAQNDLPSLLATVRRAVEAEENASHLQAELVLTERRAEEALGELISLELREEKRRIELMGLELALTEKLRDADQNLFNQYDDWLEREAALRRRDQDWRLEAEARQESVNALRAEVTAQRDELKKVIAAYRAKLDALGGIGDTKGVGQ